MVTSSNPLDAIHELHVWSARQWRAKGLSPRQLRTLVRDGDLVQTRHGVYATRRAMEYAGKDDRHAHVIAAIGASRATTGGVVSHHSAARLHGLDMLHPPDTSQVSMTFQRGPGDSTGDIVRYRGKLPRNQIEKVFGLPVTSVARTVIDIARISAFMQGVVVADSALHNGMIPGETGTTEEQLQALLGTCAGWPGLALAERVVRFADGRSESVLESCARVVFDEHGLEPPDLQVWIPGSGYRADFCWMDCQVIAETDGLAKYEEDPKRKIAEQIRRDHELRDLGWEVVHFTWEQLFRNPAKVVRAILDAMRRQRVIKASRGGGSGRERRPRYGW